MKPKQDTAHLESTLRREMEQFERLHDDLRLAVEGRDYDRADKVSRQIGQLLNMIQSDIYTARHQ